ncbi:uncharacterized protein L3040_003300 [Drepanopeziza brunnea f. sp. 'multigermtubi']|uniref:Putative Ecp7(P20) n=1 Tax=Marssonina brunnea f. sp. multigermtubi (strain MB_m1) TaxID=1072389 RepID=K1XTG6_MARBU|nr:putative Ecp7(P20) [Drepanopeziza brunnea f. sp. 'multigermtubi' MB_m1]EKD15844.1 putative Ecp7(P20) [Drepanopeziza brunnea f. sp. 'multigermtubi' MB_m1]KAJ5047476.1 hypothetical protein L3040_003300 [Drepanopeziza brunnea f. sp. 'multigermtubi']
MRFNTNLLLASFLGVATAFRRGCRPDLTSQVSGTGYYTMTDKDTWDVVAADFCTTGPELQKLNPDPAPASQGIIRVPCRVRKRDCARVPGQDNGYYRAVEGDDLTLIATDFCMTVYFLQFLNPGVENSEKVTPGTIYKVSCTFN